MKKILNLTQHLATPDQVAAGVVDVSVRHREWLLAEITFESLPDAGEMLARARQIATLVQHYVKKDDGVWNTPAVMIGGAPYFMPVLQRVLMQEGCEVLYAFARRESLDTVSPDGSIHKTSVFRHAGFVSAA